MALIFLSPLHKASRQISVYLEVHTRKLGLSPVEGHLLTYLKSYAPVPIGELVRVFGFKPSTLTSMLDRLETAGLITREVNPADRRSFVIRISDSGRELAARLNRLLEALEAEIRSRVSDEELAGFRAVMGAVGKVTEVQLRER